MTVDGNRGGGDQPSGGESWQGELRQMTSALGDVARAEVDVLKEDVAQWGRRFGIAIALFLVAFMTVFWLVALLIYSAVRGAESLFGLGPAQAALAIAGAVLLLILLLALIGYLLLRGVSSPLVAARKRYEDHRRWWRQEVLGEPEPLVGTEEP